MFQDPKTGSNLTFDSVTGTLKPTNINATGIITASSFSGNATVFELTTANVTSAVLKVMNPQTLLVILHLLTQE